MRYRRNGVTFYESSVSVNAPGYPLVLDAALNEVGPTVGDATIAGALVDVVP